MCPLELWFSSRLYTCTHQFAAPICEPAARRDANQYVQRRTPRESARTYTVHSTQYTPQTPLTMPAKVTRRRLPLPPPEVPRQTTIELLAPAVQATVLRLIELRVARFSDGRAANDEDSLHLLFETLRTNARQQFLYGFGREYDDGRGIVTGAYDASWSWHGYGMAIDIIHPRLAYKAPDKWWRILGEDYAAVGLRPGRTFKRVDSPHAQWLGVAPRLCPATPTAQDRADHRANRVSLVWKRYGVDK
jgi:peptidoglycan LD-endopeptidase CwlK